MRNYFWDFKRAFIGLPFARDIGMAFGRVSLVIAPVFILHSISSRSDKYYDLRDSELNEE